MKHKHRTRALESRHDEARMVVGIHPVEALLRTRPDDLLSLLVSPLPHRPVLEKIVAAAQRQNVPVRMAPLRELDGLCGESRHQGVVAYAKPFTYTDFDAVCAQLRSQTQALVLLLDSLQDPQNFGAIIRVAAAFAVDLIVIPKDRAVPVTMQVEKASAGMSMLVSIAQVTNLNRAMEKLKEAGFWLAGATLEEATIVTKYEFTAKTGLVIGAEGAGLRHGTLQALDARVMIPMAQGIESLNASQATSILLYEIMRQREERK